MHFTNLLFSLLVKYRDPAACQEESKPQRRLRTKPISPVPGFAAQMSAITGKLNQSS